MKFELEWGGLHTVISGGQTGADQGGLLAGWRANVKTGGQAPALYKTQDGYNPMLEVLGLTHGGDYAARTKVNIGTADATVIVAYDMKSPGTVLTRNLVRQAGKPLLELDIFDLIELARVGPANGTEPALQQIIKHGRALYDFVTKHQIQVLNVAGNREMKGDGSQYGTMVITSATDWIVGLALDLLELDGKLITKS